MTTPDQPSIREMRMKLPCELEFEQVQFPDGSALAVTVRTPAGSVTVCLSREDALSWARMIDTEAKKLSGSGLDLGGLMPSPNGNGGFLQ